MMAEHTNAAQVQHWLGLGSADPTDANLSACVAAANQTATRYAGDTPDADSKLGATMFVVRLYKRRNSVDGTISIGLDGASYIARTDPDIARLLRIDQYVTPQVG